MIKLKKFCCVGVRQQSLKEHLIDETKL